MCRILASFLACFMLIMVSYTLSDAKSDKFRTKGTVTSVNEEEQMFTIKISVNQPLLSIVKLLRL